MKCPSHADENHAIICSQCGDRLIHQNNRGPREAASGILQWIRDHCPKEMDVIDDDEDASGFEIVKQRFVPPLWRRIEHKPVGGQPRESQKFLLPRMAASIDSGINGKLYHPASGVFVVWSDPPHNNGHAAKVRPYHPFTIGAINRLVGIDWVRFWTCRDQDRWPS